MTIDEILKSFEDNDGTYKRQEIDAAIALQSEITPHLIQVLKDVLADPEKYADEENNYFGHIYAFMLLGYFKESKAHDAIIDIFSLPRDLPYGLFGDCVTSDLPFVLVNTCGGNLNRIKELVLNQDADEFCRTSAITAIKYAVLEGMIDREEVLSFYGGLFTGEEAPLTSCFYDNIGHCIRDLYPGDLMFVIKKAYEDGMIHSDFIRYEAFEKALKEGKNSCLIRLREHYEKVMLNDIHARMSWWSCFERDEEIQASSNELDHRPSLELIAPFDHAIKKAKSKKKMAKKSKRANRRKKK